MVRSVYPLIIDDHCACQGEWDVGPGLQESTAKFRASLASSCGSNMLQYATIYVENMDPSKVEAEHPPEHSCGTQFRTEVYFTSMHCLVSLVLHSKSVAICCHSW